MNLFKKEESGLVKSIQDRIDQLPKTVFDSEEDKEAIENIKKLVDIKNDLEGRTNKIDPNVIISIAGSLLLVGVIVVAERTDVLNTKAWPFVPKIF